MFVKQWENLKVAFQDLSDGVKKIFDGDVIGGIMDIFKGIGKYILKTLDNLGTTVYNIIIPRCVSPKPIFLYIMKMGTDTAIGGNIRVDKIKNIRSSLRGILNLENA